MKKYIVRKGTLVWLRYFPDSPNDKGNFVTEKRTIYDESDLYIRDGRAYVFLLPENDKKWRALSVHEKDVFVEERVG